MGPQRGREWSRLTRVPTGVALARATVAIMSITEVLGRLGVAKGRVLA